jgi:hypothetical protein
LRDRDFAELPFHTVIIPRSCSGMLAGLTAASRQST